MLFLIKFIKQTPMSVMSRVLLDNSVQIFRTYKPNVFINAMNYFLSQL